MTHRPRQPGRLQAAVLLALVAAEIGVAIAFAVHFASESDPVYGASGAFTAAVLGAILGFFVAFAFLAAVFVVVSVVVIVVVAVVGFVGDITGLDGRRIVLTIRNAVGGWRGRPRRQGERTP